MFPLIHRFVLAAVCLTLCAAASPSPLRAAVPETMSYQGLLSDDLGAPLPDGPHDLVLALYTQASGGAAIWTETQTGVMLSTGLFAVSLGSVNPLALPFDQPYWLGVSVDGGAELDPRAALAASPYALSVRLPLPANSINASTTQDEAGIAQNHSTSNPIAGGAGDPKYADMLAVTITTPADGYLLVSADGTLVMSCAATVGVQITETSHANQDNGHCAFGGGASGGVASGYVPFSLHRTYFKPAGTYTFYLQGRNLSFTACIPYAFNPTLTAIFLPTSYGSVIAAAAQPEGAAAPAVLPGATPSATPGAAIVDLRDLELRAALARAQAERAQSALEVAALRERLKSAERASKGVRP